MSRRPKRSTKKPSEFNPGDIVMVTRGDKPSARARLAQLLTTGTSPNPRWLVQYDNGSNQEVYESTFALVETTTSSSRSSSPKSETEAPPAPSTAPASKDPSPEPSETESAKASAREARSRRRQMLIDDMPSKKTKTMHPVATANDNVKKIKMLTGTLYLYRGTHRRAEFVRRV